MQCYESLPDVYNIYISERRDLMSKNKCGNCPNCGELLYPVWFIEKEWDYNQGFAHETGRVRKNVNYLLCEFCGHSESVDDSFAEPWK